MSVEVLARGRQGGSGRARIHVVEADRRSDAWLADTPGRAGTDALGRDRAWFEAQTRLYRQAMHRYALRMLRCEADASGCVQDALIAAWRARTRLRRCCGGFDSSGCGRDDRAAAP
jgi:hypothetical protein